MKKLIFPFLLVGLFAAVIYLSSCCDNVTIVNCPTCPDTTCVGPGCHDQGNGHGGQ